MDDISVYDRSKNIGIRIKSERKRLHMTQGELCNRLEDMRKVPIAQSTVSDWENGKQTPPIERLIELSKIFRCDCGYLLCDYDSRTRDSDKICQKTGLSEQSVNALCSLHAFDDNEYAAVLDFLLMDAMEREREHNYRSVLDLLSFFLRYDGSQTTRKQIFCDGYVTELRNIYISKRAIDLDDRIVENAALMEMEQALIDLKRIIREKKAGKFNG